MFTVILSSAVSMVIGLLMGGQQSRTSEHVINDLTEENRALHGQITQDNSTAEIMGTVLVLTGTALAGMIAMYWSRWDAQRKGRETCVAISPTGS